MSRRGHRLTIEQVREIHAADEPSTVLATRCRMPAVLPWEEPWVRALMISKPMFITLYDAANRGTGTVRGVSVWPPGQWRFIRAGLYRRGLIELDNRLTTCGHVAAIWAAAAMRRHWPDPARGSR